MCFPTDFIQVWRQSREPIGGKYFTKNLVNASQEVLTTSQPLKTPQKHLLNQRWAGNGDSPRDFCPHIVCHGNCPQNLSPRDLCSRSFCLSPQFCKFVSPIFQTTLENFKLKTIRDKRDRAGITSNLTSPCLGSPFFIFESWSGSPVPTF